MDSDHNRIPSRSKSQEIYAFFRRLNNEIGGPTPQKHTESTGEDNLESKYHEKNLRLDPWSSLEQSPRISPQSSSEDFSTMLNYYTSSEIDDLLNTADTDYLMSEPSHNLI